MSTRATWDASHSHSRTACIIAAGEWAGARCLFKNRDRNYEPKIRIKHEIREGVEVLYLEDDITGWREGLNEFGIGVVNSALAVALDEKEGEIAKGKASGATLRDGERMLEALQCRTIKDAVRVLQTHKGGLRGHSLVSSPDRLYSLEATWRGHDFHVRELPVDQKHVRTNHGLYHQDAGYTEEHGDRYLSSLARRDQALKVLRQVNSVSDIAPAIFGRRKTDLRDPLNMVKMTEDMRTTSQMVLDLTNRKAHLYLIPGQVEFLGYENSLPKGHEAKITFEVYEYGDIDDNGEFDLAVKKTAAAVGEHLFHPRVASWLNGETSIIPLPLVQQETEWTCGPAVLRAVLGHFGLDASEDALADVLGTDAEEGTSPEAMAALAGKVGLSARVARMNLHEVEHLVGAGIPVILNIQAWGSGHYAVAIGFDEGRLLLADPYNGQITALAPDELDERWFGDDNRDHLAIIITPNRVAARYIPASYFNENDLITFGKWQNKPGRIVRMFTDDRGIPMIEIEPIPKGRKKNRVMSLFRIRHVDPTKRTAGRVFDFPGGGGGGGRKPPAPRKTITISGQKYALSDDPGDHMSALSDGEEEEEGGEGARIIRGPGPSDPYRFLWVYNTERDYVYMWRVTDGNEKVYGPAYEFRSKIVALDRVGELNRVDGDAFRAIHRDMIRRDAEHFRRLQDAVEESKDDYQRTVDEVAQEVFDQEIVPDIERRLDEVDQGVAPFGFRVNERLLEHHDASHQMRQFVIEQEMEKFTVDLVEDELRRRGVDPDAPNHDNQAAYWALNDVKDNAWDRFLRPNRVASWYNARLPGGFTARVASWYETRFPGFSVQAKNKYKNKKKVKTKDGDEAVVYEYSERQVQNRNREKADRVEKLRKSIGDLRGQVKKDLAAKDPTKRLTALAVALIDETYERVGNDKSAEDGHYGVTGWKVEHISFKGGKATLKYVGKSGVDHTKEITDKKIVAALKDAVKGKKKSDVILCDGEDCRITSKEVNEYLKPFDVTAKDLRGLHANEEMRAKLKEVRKGKLPEDKKEREKQLKDEFKEALDAAAESVGHEASTLRSQYLVPGLEDSYLKDGTVIDSLKKATALNPLAGYFTKNAAVENFYRERWGLTATKSESEKEDDAAEALIRKEPKTKPPRKDLQKRRIEDDDSDPDAEQDEKDTSRNFKHQASVHEAWLRLAKQVDDAHQQIARSVSDPPPVPVETHKPGEVWQTDSGAWSAKSQDGEETKGGFEDEESAQAWVDGEDPEDDPEDPEDEEDPEEPEELSGDDASAKNLTRAVNDAIASAKRLVGAKNIPADLRSSLRSRLEQMGDEDRAAFGMAFADTTAALKEGASDDATALATARAALKADPDAKKKGKPKFTAEEVGTMVAQALYADRVVFNPFMIGGKKVSDKVDPASSEDLAQGEKNRLEKAKAAKDLYSKFSPEEISNMVDKLGAGPPLRSELDPNSPRAHEIDAIYYGMAMAAMLKGEEPPALEGEGWRDAKGITPVQPSEQLSQLVQAMARVGKEDLLLSSVEDFTAPESQQAVRSALGTMTDSEIHDFVKGGPLGPLAEAMLARNSKGQFRLSDADRKQFRQMIEDSIIEDIALLDPLVGDYLQASGQPNTQKARREFIETQQHKAMEAALKDMNKALDGKDRASTADLKALLAGVAKETRNAVIEAVLESENPPTSDNAAVARAVREEGDTSALKVRRVSEITEQQRLPGEIWEDVGEFFAKSPDGSVAGPYQDKNKAEQWASGAEESRLLMASLLRSYDLTPWPEFHPSHK